MDVNRTKIRCQVGYDVFVTKDVAYDVPKVTPDITADVFSLLLFFLNIMPKHVSLLRDK